MIREVEKPTAPAWIDSATTSLDIQTYLWYPDHSGRLILERASYGNR